MSRKNALDEALDQPGYPRMAPHEFDLPEAKEWFGYCGLLTKRRVAEVEKLDSVCKDILLDPNVAQGILHLILRRQPQKSGSTTSTLLRSYTSFASAPGSVVGSECSRPRNL